jgi:hypothetical protein
VIVGWTGHRPELFLKQERARAAVESAAREIVTAGADRFIVGGQRGVDTWAALAALQLAVPFCLVLPFSRDEFADKWSPEDRAILDETIARAADVRIADGYSERNREVARAGDLLIAVWTGTRGGGTAETIGFARGFGTPVREIVLEAAPDAASAQGRGI